MPQLPLPGKRFLDAWYSFGLRGALDVRRARRHPNSVYPVRVAACRRPLWVRRDSTDFMVLEDAVEFCRGFVPEGFSPKTVVDLGANTGFTASVFAARWPEARVIAVEPERANFEMLQRNCQPIGSITPVYGAVWSQDGEVEISNPSEGAWGFRVQDARRSGSDVSGIPAYSMRTLMERYSLPALDVVKMDIEGAEKGVLESDPAQWLRHVRVLIVELHDRIVPGCSDALAAAVASIPHKRFARDEYDVLYFERAD